MPSAKTYWMASNKSEILLAFFMLSIRWLKSHIWYVNHTYHNQQAFWHLYSIHEKSHCDISHSPKHAQQQSTMKHAHILLDKLYFHEIKWWSFNQNSFLWHATSLSTLSKNINDSMEWFIWHMKFTLLGLWNSITKIIFFMVFTGKQLWLFLQDFDIFDSRHANFFCIITPGHWASYCDIATSV